MSFGATPAAKYKVESPTSIVAESPTGKGTAAVTVKTPGGTSAETTADLYTYDPVPTVAKVTPTEGPEAVSYTHLDVYKRQMCPRQN